MTSSTSDDYSLNFEEVSIDPTMYELFCVELESQCKVLNQGLLEIEQKLNDPSSHHWEVVMRAAHSIKGAARIVNLTFIVHLAHALEDCLVSLQKGSRSLSVDLMNFLLKQVDFLTLLSKVPLNELNQWLQKQSSSIHTSIGLLQNASMKPNSQILLGTAVEKEADFPVTSPKPTIKRERILKMTAKNMDRLLGLAGESLIESNWLYPFTQSLMTFKKDLQLLVNQVDSLWVKLSSEKINPEVKENLLQLHNKLNAVRQHFNERLSDLDNFIRRYAYLSDRLYHEVIDSSMRPFSDGIENFPRLVRDLSLELGKQVKLEIEGQSKLVDRDILERLEVPLTHLIRNAIDHGIETPEERIAAKKKAEGIICLKAEHRGGVLFISVSDDGRGVDLKKLKTKIVEKKLLTEERVQGLNVEELLAFLFMPGFSTAPTVSEISGRGIGLNIVQNTIEEIGGSIHATFTPGKGMEVQLKLPLTLSVIRTLLTQISGESYAFPLARIDRTLVIDRDKIIFKDEDVFLSYRGKKIPLFWMSQILELNPLSRDQKQLSIVIVTVMEKSYGMIVDSFTGEKDLIVQPLNPRLGKVTDIISAAIMEDGNPVLILDLVEIFHSIDRKINERLTVETAEISMKNSKRKKILVVEDSSSIRELEFHLLKKWGYDVQTAIDGMDGWNAIKLGQYDLVITDVEMPRMDGIDLIRCIRADKDLHEIPIIVLSYRESDEDRKIGLEAGANIYLGKSEFRDETLIQAVKTLMNCS